MIFSISSAGKSSVAVPEIVTEATAPVMVGIDDGIVETGAIDGDVLGTNVGAAVMKTSQQETRSN